jgi:putative oxidoreductase
MRSDVVVTAMKEPAAGRSSPPREWFIAARTLLGAIPLALFLFAIRIGVALVFFTSGRIKLITWDFTVKLFSDEYKLPVIPPDIAATIAAFCELTFSSLIIVGLATRLATLPLLGMLAVIEAFVYPDSWPDTLFWGASLLLILSRGPGPISIDAAIEQAIRTRSGPWIVFAAGLVLTALSIGAWYFTYNDRVHATLACLFTQVQCNDATLVGLAPVAPYLPYHPALMWASLAITLVGLAWMFMLPKAQPSQHPAPKL